MSSFRLSNGSSASTSLTQPARLLKESYWSMPIEDRSAFHCSCPRAAMVQRMLKVDRRVQVQPVRRPPRDADIEVIFIPEGAQMGETFHAARSGSCSPPPAGPRGGRAPARAQPPVGTVARVSRSTPIRGPAPGRSSGLARASTQGDRPGRRCGFGKTRQRLLRSARVPLTRSAPKAPTRLSPQRISWASRRSC